MYCHIFIRDNKLHWITHMRSNDIILGLRNDLYCFCKMQVTMWNQLKLFYRDLELGDYIHCADSLHIYEKNFKKMNEFVSTNK